MKRLATALRAWSGPSILNTSNQGHLDAVTSLLIADSTRAVILAQFEPGVELSIEKLVARNDLPVRAVRSVLDDFVAADLVAPVLGKPRWRLTIRGASWVITSRGAAVPEFGRRER
ncbi:hypothetical protein FMUBM48_09440 [Nocardia cyriacigeorgica]|nr:hypothetical protein FMUBM48_09440 [Nocardia cyriacigeorgica]